VVTHALTLLFERFFVGQELTIQHAHSSIIYFYQTTVQESLRVALREKQVI